jgi:hypothetical protein
MEDLVDLADDVDTYGDGEEDVADDKDRAGVFQRLLGTTATSWKNQIWQSMETIIIY